MALFWLSQDEAGNKVEQRHYDAWGNLTHLQIGSGGIITDKELIANSQLLIARGYTSHEHLLKVGLIHMNGRLYDPLLRRFLNADEHIQDPYNTRNYNKYGYVYNNPLMYNDPSGEFIFAFVAAWGLSKLAGTLITAAIIGASVGLASYTIGLAVSNNLHQWSLWGALKATFWGAVGGVASAGLGELFQVAKVVTALGEAKFLVQAAAHGISQGVLSVFQGGDFWSGAAGGFFGSLGAELWGVTMNGLGLADFASSAGGTIAFGALSGGIGAELSGGNFWQGAVTGGIVAGLNHSLHRIAENNRIRSALSNPNGVPEANIDAVNEIKSEVYELFTSDMKKYENSAVVNIDLETNSSFAGSTSGGIINSKTGKFSGKIKVTFYKQAFQTNYSLAKAILHEFYHVADFASGFVTKSYLNYKKRFDTKTSINKIRALNEVRAYKYIYNLGDNTSVLSPEIRKKYGL